MTEEWKYEPTPANKRKDTYILDALKLMGGCGRTSDICAAANLRSQQVSSRLFWLKKAGKVVPYGEGYALPGMDKGELDKKREPSPHYEPKLAPKPRTQEDIVLDDFTNKLRTAGPTAAMEALRELDKDFVKAILKRYMATLSRSQQMRLAQVARKMEEDWKPTTDDELWHYILAEMDLKIPRKSVCTGHNAPFDFLADCFFERGNVDKLAVGNRGSGKTQISGVLNACNVKLKKNYTSCTVGAVEAQAHRAYGYFRDIVTTKPKWGDMVKGKVLMGGTDFTNGSKVEIVIGTITGVNSPHPIFAHWDEVELLRPGVFDEGLNMAQSKHGHQAMNVLTSSWKKPKGFVTELIDEEQRAKRERRSPPYQVYRWCVWETTEPCPHDCNSCPFDADIKGAWEDGTPRSFESACKKGSPEEGVGKLKFTDGFVPVQDAVVRFRKLPRRVWEAQQESKRPTLEGLIYDCFDEDMHTIEEWHPDPENGDIYVGLDFGGTNPHAAIFIQHLRVGVRQSGKSLVEGTFVLFDEVYIKDVGNVEFGRLVNARINYWRLAYPSFTVAHFYRDPAAKAAGADLYKLSSYGQGPEFFDIRSTSMGRVEVESRIGLVYELVTKNQVMVDRFRCENFMNEIGGYDYNENTGKPNKDDDHLMDAWGYAMWNLHAKNRRSIGSTPPRTRDRPRAVKVTEGERQWDPAALGTTPSYGKSKEFEESVGKAGYSPRIRSIGF